MRPYVSACEECCWQKPESVPRHTPKPAELRLASRNRSSRFRGLLPETTRPWMLPLPLNLLSAMRAIPSSATWPNLAQLRQTRNSFLAYQHFVIAACCLIAVPTQIAAGWHVLSYTLIVQCSEGLSSSRRLPLRTARQCQGGQSAYGDAM
jgi:hypothetical protein